MAEFTQRLKEMRTEMGMTQKELADMAGLRQSHISAWEKGIRTPLADGLIVLAKCLNCTIDYLVGVSDDRNSKQKSQGSEEEIIDNYSKLNDNGKAMVQGYIDGLLKNPTYSL